MLPSQQMNTDVYPDFFTEDDKVNFDILIAEAKRIFPKYEEWMIKIAVTAYIYQEKGLTVSKSQEEIEELKNKYDLTDTKLYETPIDETIEIKHKAIIYA